MRLIALIATGITAPFAPGAPYGPGHRGVDFAAVAGDPVTAPIAGELSFVGTVAGVGTVTISVGSRKVTLQPVSSTLSPGSHIERGAIVGRVQHVKYHCTCLHVGVREKERYVDPTFLSRSQLLPVGRSSWISVS